eukprot:CAMPEP_0194097856 /NCGR_PEP_ID=MMETSP0149-20130528/58078_1 /TAXON_ID=122233 /ORGANISM="Chaetoceros debilis, Strain MM31A-1" /LENGTH=318 /DNA_ID=CAMNT_0038783885 /DNA_START=107 /DNA_END=1063 /DNA_ORIENTATION=+
MPKPSDKTLELMHRADVVLKQNRKRLVISQNWMRRSNSSGNVARRGGVARGGDAKIPDRQYSSYYHRTPLNLRPKFMKETKETSDPNKYNDAATMIPRIIKIDHDENEVESECSISTRIISMHPATNLPVPVPAPVPAPAPAPAPAPVYSIDPSKEVLEKTSSFGFGLARDHGHHHEQDHAKHTVQQTDLHKFTRIHTQDPKRNSKILSFRNRTRQLEQKFESESKGLGLDLHRNKSFTKHGCDDNDDGNDDSSMLSPLTFFVSRTSTQQSRSSIADLKMKKMQMELARDRKRIRIPSVIFTSASNPILASSPSLELV